MQQQTSLSHAEHDPIDTIGTPSTSLEPLSTPTEGHTPPTALELLQEKHEEQVATLLYTGQPIALLSGLYILSTDIVDDEKLYYWLGAHIGALLVGLLMEKPTRRIRKQYFLYQQKRKHAHSHAKRSITLPHVVSQIAQPRVTQAG